MHDKNGRPLVDQPLDDSDDDLSVYDDSSSDISHFVSDDSDGSDGSNSPSPSDERYHSLDSTLNSRQASAPRLSAEEELRNAIAKSRFVPRPVSGRFWFGGKLSQYRLPDSRLTTNTLVELPEGVDDPKDAIDFRLNMDGLYSVLLSKAKRLVEEGGAVRKVFDLSVWKELSSLFPNPEAYRSSLASLSYRTESLTDSAKSLLSSMDDRQDGPVLLLELKELIDSNAKLFDETLFENRVAFEKSLNLLKNKGRYRSAFLKTYAKRFVRKGFVEEDAKNLAADLLDEVFAASKEAFKKMDHLRTSLKAISSLIGNQHLDWVSPSKSQASADVFVDDALHQVRSRGFAIEQLREKDLIGERLKIDALAKAFDLSEGCAQLGSRELAYVAKECSNMLGASLFIYKSNIPASMSKLIPSYDSCVLAFNPEMRRHLENLSSNDFTQSRLSSFRLVEVSQFLQTCLEKTEDLINDLPASPEHQAFVLAAKSLLQSIKTATAVLRYPNVLAPRDIGKDKGKSVGRNRGKGKSKGRGGEFSVAEYIGAIDGNLGEAENLTADVGFGQFFQLARLLHGANEKTLDRLIDGIANLSVPEEESGAALAFSRITALLRGFDEATLALRRKDLIGFYRSYSNMAQLFDKDPNLKDLMKNRYHFALSFVSGINDTMKNLGYKNYPFSQNIDKEQNAGVTRFVRSYYRPPVPVQKLMNFRKMQLADGLDEPDLDGNALGEIDRPLVLPSEGNFFTKEDLRSYAGSNASRLTPDRLGYRDQTHDDETHYEAQDEMRRGAGSGGAAEGAEDLDSSLFDSLRSNVGSIYSDYVDYAKPSTNYADRILSLRNGDPRYPYAYRESPRVSFLNQDLGDFDEQWPSPLARREAAAKEIHKTLQKDLKSARRAALAISPDALELARLRSSRLSSHGKFTPRAPSGFGLASFDKPDRRAVGPLKSAQKRKYASGYFVVPQDGSRTSVHGHKGNIKAGLDGVGGTGGIGGIVVAKGKSKVKSKGVGNGNGHTFQKEKPSSPLRLLGNSVLPPISGGVSGRNSVVGAVANANKPANVVRPRGGALPPIKRLYKSAHKPTAAAPKMIVEGKEPLSSTPNYPPSGSSLALKVGYSQKGRRKSSGAASVWSLKSAKSGITGISGVSVMGGVDKAGSGFSRG